MSVTTAQSSQANALRFTPKESYVVAKRAIDVVVAGVALVVLSPILLLIAIVVKLDSRGPVIFAQDRVAGNQPLGKSHPERNTFQFFKFRSMYVNCDSAAHKAYVTQLINGHSGTNNGSNHNPVYKMKHDPRITRVGRFLRRTSLDELPQLFNVLKGNMSLVGPRPALPYEVEQYKPGDCLRLIPQAGITGLWQVSGRTTLSFQEMIALDVRYAQERTLAMDLNILLRTIPTILSGDGAW